MHYKNGRPAKVGDQIVIKDFHGIARTIVVIKLLPDAKTCNVAGIAIGGGEGYSSITSSEAVHIDDALNPAAYVEQGQSYDTTQGT